MTAKLMLPFMRAFRDEYVSVRKEACIAAGNLRIQDDSLISELLRLSNRDPIWRIKALAIQGKDCVHLFILIVQTSSKNVGSHTQLLLPLYLAFEVH